MVQNPRPKGRERSRGCPAARLRRYRRHVGAARRRTGQDHTIVIPDLRGMGLSSHPEGGYDKKTQATDIARILDN